MEKATTMRFLYGIKNCHRCALREACNLKNDPKTLTEKPVTIEHMNRGILRHGAKPVKISSFCKMFRIEEKTFKPPTTKKELTIKPVEDGMIGEHQIPKHLLEKKRKEPPAMLTTPFNVDKKDDKNGKD